MSVQSQYLGLTELSEFKNYLQKIINEWIYAILAFSYLLYLCVQEAVVVFIQHKQANREHWHLILIPTDYLMKKDVHTIKY